MLPFLAAIVLSGHFQITAASPSGLLPRQNPVTDLPANWTFVGCFVDPGDQRALGAATFVNTTSMTVESCVAFCNGQNFAFAGLEFTQECWCDNVFEGEADLVGNHECNLACVGNPEQDCGGASRLSVYTSGIPAKFPTVVPSVGAWESLGCFNDSIQARILKVSLAIPISTLTAETCTSICFINGFTLAGLEFGQECWCGSEIANGGIFVGNGNGISGNPPVRTTVGGPFCDLPCSANPSELCGGSDRMNLFNFTGSTTPAVQSLPNQALLGCFRDGAGSLAPLRPGPTLLTLSLETCSGSCFLEGFPLSGLAEGTRCLCDSQIQNATGSPLLDSSACNTPCATSPFEICGGPNAVNIFQFQNVQPVTDALNALTAPGNTLIALINSVTAANVATVGPQVGPTIEAFVSALGGAETTVAPTVTVTGHFDPLIGTFAQQTVTLLQTQVPTVISAIFTALSNKSTILATGFSAPISTGLKDLMNAGVALVLEFGSNITPSFQQQCLSMQTQIEMSFNTVQAKFTH